MGTFFTGFVLIASVPSRPITWFVGIVLVILSVSVAVPTSRRWIISGAVVLVISILGSASIAGVLAHAGRVVVPIGKDPVEVACLAMWDAIRADIPVVATVASDLETAKHRVAALRKCAPLWFDGMPDWATHH